MVGLVDRAEYKRRQMPPGVRISGKAFGKDRRMPITNHYRSGPIRVRRLPASHAGRRRRLSELLDRPSPPTGPADPWPSTRHGRRSAQPRARRRLPLSLGATAALVGEYRWIENALYGMLGAWVTDMPVAAVQVHLDAQSLRHAWHADLWADRLPVLAGADPGGPDRAVGHQRRAVRRPGRLSRRRTGVPGSTWPPADEEPAGRPGALPRLAGLYRVVLPRLVTSYERHLAVAVGPVTDGPVARALRLVLNDEIEDWHAGERLVQRLVTRPHDVAAVHEFLQRLEIGGGGRRGPVGPGRSARVGARGLSPEPALRPAAVA